MKAPELSYRRAESVPHVFELLARYGDDARVLAGGQSLMPTLNMRLSKPALLIDINGLEALTGITLEDDVVRIGALARHAEVMRSQIVAQNVPLIAEAMPHVAHVAVRSHISMSTSLSALDAGLDVRHEHRYTCMFICMIYHIAYMYIYTHIHI